MFSFEPFRSSRKGFFVYPAVAVLAALLTSSCSPNDSGTVPAAAVVNPAQGQAASLVACSMCHAYPEPALLEKAAWKNHVLPRMRLLAGLEQPDRAQMHNPELASNTNIFPAQPLIAPELWPSIEAWYLQNAPEGQPPLAREPIPETLALFRPEPLPFKIPSPTTTFLAVEPATRSVVFADAKTETIYSVGAAQAPDWTLAASNIVTHIAMAGPVRFIVGIGDFFPSDDPFGAVLRFDPSAAGTTLRPLLSGLPRTTHLEPADLNGDGQLDFALSIFGNLLGRFSWFESRGPDLAEHVLIDKPGALKSVARDFNGDGKVDLAVLMAQGSEAFIICTNQGNGQFVSGEIFRKPPAWGHTDFEMADMNHDNWPDLVVANGDNADFQAQPRPCHGLRIYLGEPQGFREAWFFPFYGAYRVLPRDFDADGDVDIAAVSFFPDFASRPEPFVYLENQGGLRFQPFTFPDANRGRWLTMDAGDLDGDGDVDLALAAMAEMPDAAPAAARRRWERESPSVLVLRNQLR